MIDQKELAGAYARNSSIVRSQARGLTHSDSLIQPPLRGNCLNWALGHLVGNHEDVVAMLGEPRMFQGRLVRSQRESDPLTREEQDTIHLEELVEWFGWGQARIGEWLEHAEPAELAATVTFGHSQSTVARRFVFDYFHETGHGGQAELLRQPAGKNDRAI